MIRVASAGSIAGMTTTQVTARGAGAGWWVAGGLVVLSLVPAVGGGIRLAELAGAPEVTPANARFVADPGPLVLHIVAATVFCLLGAFQFVPRLRRTAWHRRAGRLLVPCGLLAAGAGGWMAVVYPDAPGDGPLLRAMRLAVGAAMLGATGLAFLAVRRRDITTHRRWMIRGYAIGQGAGSQVLTSAFAVLVLGIEAPGEVGRALILGAGWALNIAVAEIVVRRPAG
jgi:hypothetical protein